LVTGNLGDEVGAGGSTAKWFEYDIQGQVKSADTAHLVIETCAPNTNCSSSQIAIQISGPPFPQSALAPVGALVDLQYYEALPVPLDATTPGPFNDVVLSNIPTWGSLVNPVLDNQRIWFAASARAGGSAPEPPASFYPYVVTNAPAPGCGSALDPVSGFSFQMPNAPSLVVLPGAQGSVEATGARAGHYTFQALNNITGDTGLYQGYWISGS
jgi:hypothetical protein